MIRISTITATAKLSIRLNLQSLKNMTFDNGEFVVTDTVKFGNQITLKNPMDHVSVKLFRNGSIHMTGLKSEQDMLVKANKVLEFLQRVAVENINISDVKVVMINSDFDAGIRIHREKLCQHMIRHHHHILCSYEPCIYQGVIIKYMCNDKPHSHQGVCQCDAVTCNGKGRGLGHGNCRKVSIIVFHSGKVLITGAVTMAQIQEAHCFINNELHQWHTTLLL